MPKLIRLKPADRSSSRSQAATLSGLASVVISTSSASPNSAAALAITAPRSAGGSRVGVPPPKKIVSILTSRWPSTRRASRISSMTAPAYVEREAPGVSPSSSAV